MRTWWNDPDRTDYSLEANKLTPKKAIRAKCLDCVGWQSAEVVKCVCKDCSLYPYRFGRAVTYDDSGVLIDNQAEAARVRRERTPNSNRGRHFLKQKS